MSSTTKPRLLCMVDLSGAPAALARLRQVAHVDYLPSDRKVLLETIQDYGAFWGHVELKIDSEVLGRATNFRVINTASTGTDHIDLCETDRRGVRVLSITEDYGLLEAFMATAECAWMLTLACLRHFRAAVRHVLRGQWASENFIGRQLSDLTFGVLGVGRLGRMTCGYAKAFCRRTLGCDLRRFSIDKVEQVSFDRLLQRADVISIHIHMRPQNFHLFNRDRFAKMRKGAVLVNTSRGDIIDESALIEALDSGRLAAFGADVLSNEWRDHMGDSPLVRYARTHDNVVITPHMGGRTDTSIWRAREFSADKLAHYLLTGKDLRLPG